MRFPIVNTNVFGLAIVGAFAVNAQDTSNTDSIDSVSGLLVPSLSLVRLRDWIEVEDITPMYPFR